VSQPRHLLGTFAQPPATRSDERLTDPFGWGERSERPQCSPRPPPSSPPTGVVGRAPVTCAARSFPLRWALSHAWLRPGRPDLSGDVSLGARRERVCFGGEAQPCSGAANGSRAGRTPHRAAMRQRQPRGHTVSSARWAAQLLPRRLPAAQHGHNPRGGFVAVLSRFECASSPCAAGVGSTVRRSSAGSRPAPPPTSAGSAILTEGPQVDVSVTPPGLSHPACTHGEPTDRRFT
jgi:hypothetical protein